MFKRNLVSFAALGVFVTLAFGSTPDIMEQIEEAAEAADANGGGGGDVELGSGSGGGGNVAACKRYLAHYNSLECLPNNLPETTCVDSMDMLPTDLSGYYDCMIENSKCKGAMPDISGMANCKMPTM